MLVYPVKQERVRELGCLRPLCLTVLAAIRHGQRTGDPWVSGASEKTPGSCWGEGCGVLGGATPKGRDITETGDSGRSKFWWAVPGWSEDLHRAGCIQAKSLM